MLTTGFYKFEVVRTGLNTGKGQFNLIDFFKQNLLGFCNLIDFKVSPSVVVASTESVIGFAKKRPCAIRYFKQEITVRGRKKQYNQQLVNVFVLDPNIISLYGQMVCQRQLDAHSIISLWDEVFHGVREFVQSQILKPDQLFIESMLEDMVLITPAARIQSLRQTFAILAQEDPGHLASYIDACCGAWYAGVTMIASGKGREFDENAVKTALMSSRQDYEQNRVDWLKAANK